MDKVSETADIIVPVIKRFIEKRYKIEKDISMKGRRSIPNHICESCKQVFDESQKKHRFDLKNPCPVKKGWLYYSNECRYSHFLMLHILSEESIDVECNIQKPEDIFPIGSSFFRPMYLLRKFKILGSSPNFELN